VAVVLRPRQYKVAKLLSQGLTNHEIADRIGTTENATKNYVREVFDITGMSNRVELALWFIVHGADARATRRSGANGRHAT